MGYMIITKDKKQKMADLVEDMLYAGGRLMSCIEELHEGDDYDMGMRGRYGMRENDRYGMRDGYGMREDRFRDDDIQERRYRRRY